MLILLSPAKKMKEGRTTALPTSAPRLHADTDELVAVSERLSTAHLKSLMKLSDALAELNTMRYTDFHSQAEHPAALLYDGDTYWGLNAASLDDDAMTYANDRVRILSGLYGALRPLDRIRPHRLEMGTRLQTPRGANLYQFWGTRIADSIRDDLEPFEDRSILNLASHEYFKSVDRSALDRPVITAKFLQIKNGEPRNLGLFAKRARGQLARFMIDNRADRVSAARDFDYDGYRLDPAQSTDTDYVFTRAQPDPVTPDPVTKATKPTP